MADVGQVRLRRGRDYKGAGWKSVKFSGANRGSEDRLLWRSDSSLPLRDSSRSFEFIPSSSRRRLTIIDLDTEPEA